LILITGCLPSKERLKPLQFSERPSVEEPAPCPFPKFSTGSDPKTPRLKRRGGRLSRKSPFSRKTSHFNFQGGGREYLVTEGEYSPPRPFSYKREPSRSLQSLWSKASSWRTHLRSGGFAFGWTPSSPGGGGEGGGGEGEGVEFSSRHRDIKCKKRAERCQEKKFFFQHQKGGGIGRARFSSSLRNLNACRCFRSWEDEKKGADVGKPLQMEMQSDILDREKQTVLERLAKAFSSGGRPLKLRKAMVRLFPSKQISLGGEFVKNLEGTSLLSFYQILFSEIEEA